MFDPAEYELLDFGGGRKLERFGPVVLDRPSPAASGEVAAQAELWSTATARFELTPTHSGASARGQWSIHGELPTSWIIRHGQARFGLKLTDFGHVGIFPEQAAMWDRISVESRAAGTCKTSDGSIDVDREFRVLNLFAYTGGGTLAAAAAGAAVTHVDAAHNVVNWARRNAELSGLATKPIRWISEDAQRFVRRELKRGHCYDAVILDPPSYGHGPSGEVWSLNEHLPALLSCCRELLSSGPQFLLLTAHSAEYGAPQLAAAVREAGFELNANDIQSDDLWIESTGSRRLHSGTFAWIRPEEKQSV